MKFIFQSTRKRQESISKVMLRNKRPVGSPRPQDRRRQASRHKQEESADEGRFERDSSNSSYRKLINNPIDQFESDDTQELEDHWRENAQIFTDDDQFLFQDRNKILRQQEQRIQQFANKKSSSYNQKQSQQQVPVYLENARSTPESGQSRDTNSADNEADDDEQVGDEDEDDDDSSISFAQSGCHSILSAWRIKAANRAARRLSRNNGSSNQRPTSVLSNGSSAITKKSLLSNAFSSRAGKSPASQTRIQLGPAQAQHFVTNSRRRRQANELILETLEARRRALTLNRQNVASLFGSSSYLEGVGIDGGAATTGGLVSINKPPANKVEVAGDPSALLQASSDDYNTRLSLSPSPIGRRGANLSPTALQLRHRTPMSDLGGRQLSGSSSRSKSPTLDREQEKRLNAGANYKRHSKESLKSKSPPAAPRRPPLAKLDQNSSDLYSSNSSSSDSSESSGSQFTQLVTSELAPDCILLDEQALRQSQQQQQKQSLLATNNNKPIQQQQRPTLPSKQPRESFKRPSPVSVEQSNSNTFAQMKPPKVPERTKRKQKHTSLEPVSGSVLERKTESELEASSRLRRGALRRDSIRRLRLNRAPPLQQQQQQSEPDSSSDVANSASSNRLDNEKMQQPLSPTRKLDIESNPFLNRGHFRSNSVRTMSNTSETAPIISTDSTPKRNSWLFGSTRSSKQNELEAPERPRLFSEARRSNSTDRLTAGKANKPHQQQTNQSEAQQQREEIRRVERMLRQMKPNQVFTSYTRDENDQLSSMHSSSQMMPSSSRIREAKSSELPPTGATSYIKPKVNVTSGRSYDNLTPMRIVRENYLNPLSRDSSKFDSTPRNRGQYEERIQYEKSSSRLQSSGLGIEKMRSEKIVNSERTEIKRSSSISPPVEFADHPKQQMKTPSYPQQYQYQDKQTNLQPNKESTRNSSEQEQKLIRSRSPIAQQQPRQVAPTGLVRRALSEERPAIVSRGKVGPLNEPVGGQSNSILQTNRPVQQQQAVTSESKLLQNQPSLPKFERTADDEFKKRVDYLRKLAHANLSDEPLVSRATQQKKATEKPLTKPMSTNWRQSSSSEEQGSKKERPALSSNRWSYEPSLTSERSREHAPSVAMTNIDSLLADRYQLPLSERVPYSGLKWRRSNSSLASVPTSRSSRFAEQPSQADLSTSDIKKHHQLQEPQTHQHRERTQSVLSYPEQEQACSSKPRELTSSAVVKLVVKEKSAPKLDYAHVERQQQQTPPSSRQQIESQSQSTARPNQQAVGARQAPAQLNTTWTRPALRVASPKSPDFGATATSSNDDSAIASSVSSPSLSFMMNQAGSEQTTKPTLQLVRPTGGSASPIKPSITPRVRSVNLPTVQRVDESPVGNAGVLQGILRRQQQSSLDANHPESSTVIRQQQQVVETLEPTVKRAQIEQQPQEAYQSDTQFYTSELANDRGTNEKLQTDDSREEQATGFGIRRVHFNDKTSIRSFESVSSLASNSTAVPNETLRQQVGSPDSMGSGSTSRLSAESPDLRKTSGAAIYAVRGDPELELENSNNLMAIHQQVIQQRRPLQYVPKYLDHHSAMIQAPSSSVPYLRMTAPPSISTAGASPQCSPQQHQLAQASPSSQIQYIVRPTSLTSTQIVPTRAVMNAPSSVAMLNPMVVKPNIVVTAADDDDDSYALRLRQAATSGRVFNYTSGPPSSPVITQHSPALSSPVQSTTITSGQKKPYQQEQQSSQQQQQRQQQQQVHSRRHLDDLRNYQTEV